jgi:hypothetical protein
MTSTGRSPAPRHARACSGTDVRDLLEALAGWLESHAGHLNALNVFPVPDGDTGTNMSRTLRAAAESAANAEGDAAETFAVASRGALLGAAGNSGVILSQMLRGFSDSIAGGVAFDGDKIGAGLAAAAEAGYKSVARPVEGTMLTVAREAAAAVGPSQSLLGAFAQAVSGAAEAVEATPTQLEKLRLAGVVDAGGEGLRLILEGVERWLRGEDIRSAAPPGVVSRALVGAQHTDDAIGFCTQFLIERSALSEEELKARIEPLSTSVIVVSADDLIRVHAHAALPGRLLDLAVQAGMVSRVSIENMELQHESARAETESGQSGIVAVAQSEMAARLLESLGATAAVVPTEVSPTVQELLNALQRLGHEHVLILPGDKNSVLTAEQLRGLTTRSVHIIPTEHVVQSMQCLLALNPEQAIEAQISRLTAALTDTRIIELARANRATQLPNASVTVGSIVAIHNGEVVAAGESAVAAVEHALGAVGGIKADLVTLHPCADLDPADLPDLEARCPADSR